MGLIFFLLLAIVVLAVVGGTILGILLHVIWWAIVGLVVGLLARLVLTDARSGIGLFQTILFGIAGALLGGVIAGAFDVNWFIEFILAVLVAAVLIVAFGSTSRRSGSGVTRPD
jgi:uncharacterized membrane protein YeaQ/YmgE (transglycosylase-associated protein family)